MFEHATHLVCPKCKINNLDEMTGNSKSVIAPKFKVLYCDNCAIVWDVQLPDELWCSQEQYNYIYEYEEGGDNG